MNQRINDLILSLDKEYQKKANHIIKDILESENLMKVNNSCNSEKSKSDKRKDCEGNNTE